MDYKCINKKCKEFDIVIGLSTVKVKFVDGKRVTDAMCKSCNTELEDLAEFTGYGIALKNKKSVSKNYYKRYKG